MLKLNKADLISYASAFTSFILKELQGFNIKEVILFGSVERNNFDEKSDIDIFINIQNSKDSAEIDKEVKNSLEKFYKSKIREIWSNKGITNPIKVKVGVLEEWKLKRSILTDGIVLFGKYKEQPENIEHYNLIVFEPIEDIAKRNRLIRRLFGRKEGKTIYAGLVEELKGKKLSPTSFIIPLAFADKIFDLLKKERIDYKFYEVWSDQFKV